MSYLLDTDSLGNPHKKAPSATLFKKLASIPVAEQFTSTITVGEMTYGDLRRTAPKGTAWFPIAPFRRTIFST